MAPFAPRSVLIIQTAFTGDVILATGLIEKIHAAFPVAAVDFLVRKGNEGLLLAHPILREVLIWDKKRGKITNLISIIRNVRRRRYDAVINVHRFLSSGLITVLSRSAYTVGFDKNPLAFLFSKRVPHTMDGAHEIERNQKLIASLTGDVAAHPRLYPGQREFASVTAYKESPRGYCCVAPTSVWFTKQFPRERWAELLDHPVFLSKNIFLLGAPADVETCEFIRLATKHPRVSNLAGKLSFLESAALMKDAEMNYVNDSAPMHIASAMNAPVTAIYCSTIPAFGFGPLSDQRRLVETKEHLDCRPCGLHGFKGCPLGHFRCAFSIGITDVTGER